MFPCPQRLAAHLMMTEALIGREARPAPRAADSLDLGERLLGIGDVMENHLRKHHVEAVVFEGEVDRDLVWRAKSPIHTF